MIQMKSRAPEFFVVIMIVVIAGVVFHKSYMAPTRLVRYSTSPDSSIRVEFLTEGYWGKSWIDVISEKPAKNKMTIYSEAGNEVIFPDDLEVFWSKDSSKFLAVSARISSIPSQLKQSSSIQLKSGENMVVMYDFPNKILRHNLYPQPNSPATPFQMSDIDPLEWNDKNKTLQ
jgi:hypothetical protein